MRKIIAAAATVALAAAGVLGTPTAYADDEATTTQEPTAPAVPEPPVETAPSGETVPPLPEAAAVAPDPAVALTTVRRVLAGRALPRDPSATVALRDLYMSRARLSGAERREADSLLARPTDGAADPQGFGYTGSTTQTCNTRLCVTRVTTRRDPDRATPRFAARTLEVMDQIWSGEVDGLGFRPPLPDGARGGSPLFDIYLKDLGAAKLYGYCAVESTGPRRTGVGFCVLDNNYAARQFPTGTPDGNLRVTAAHEFFHAVQYAYDYAEDPWMMESTATWMEERLADDVNDNRQYLGFGQLYSPLVPLDVFSSNSFHQYGNWIFWEYLSTRYGVDVVREAWEEAGTLPGDGHEYSFVALKKVLGGRDALIKTYAKFAGGNMAPAESYPEGGRYRVPRPGATAVLTRARRDARYAKRLYHMSSSSFRLVPGRGLDGRRWKLAVRVDGPLRRTAPAAHVVVHLEDGGVQRRYVKLNRRGDRRVAVPFDNTVVAAVSVTLVNASTRMRCSRRTLLACGGRSRDDNLPFAVTARVVTRR